MRFNFYSDTFDCFLPLYIQRDTSKRQEESHNKRENIVFRDSISQIFATFVRQSPNRSLDRKSITGNGKDHFLPSFIFLLASRFSFVLDVARYAIDQTRNKLLNNQVKSNQNLTIDWG